MSDLKIETTSEEKIENIETPNIPVDHMDFANEVAIIADKFGMDKFTMEYRPCFKKRVDWPNSLGGTIKIIYSSVDGRGRPSRNLNIQLESTLRISVVTTKPENKGG